MDVEKSHVLFCAEIFFSAVQFVVDKFQLDTIFCVNQNMKKFPNKKGKKGIDKRV